MTLADALKLCVEALKQVLDENFNADRLDAAIIRTADRKFEKVDKKELDKLMKQK
jgi:20S proteasome alpha/beta subunit